MRKSLAITLSVLLLLVCVPLGAVSVYAATSGITGDCTWVLNGTHLTISGNGKMGDYDGAYVDGAYCTTAPWSSNITAVTIEDGVTTIGDHAFYWCQSLTSVTIPDSVTTIKGYAFSHCTSLETVTIPNSVTSIEKWSFASCHALSSVIIPNGVTTISYYSFSSCWNLTSVTIPNSVRTIGEGAFSTCSKLTSVIIPDSVTTIGQYSFTDCPLTSIVIPSSVTFIGAKAFRGCDELSDVYYKGDHTNRTAISIGTDNSYLLNAIWHYNYVPACDHVYDDANDTTCNECGAVRQIAAQVLTYGGSSISEDVNGLAFRFDANVSGALVENGNEYVTGSATVTPFVGGENYKLVRMGAILSNSGEATLDIQHADGKRVVNIEAVRLCDRSADAASFAVRLINIPENGKNVEIFARPYYVYEADGEEIVVYGDAVSQIYTDV